MNSSPNLGRLVAVDVRSIWKHEALDFTPWLAQPANIAVLAETLHLGSLEVEATEKDVGRFSADIVARDEAGDIVLIENQLEATDHRHLGQVLTYLAGLEGTATIVWVATTFLEEHRAAVDWLNANTIERYSFFGVEIELLKIADSPPAPLFNVVAKPNDWSRGVRYTARQIGENPLNGTQSFNLGWWQSFGAYLAAKNAGFRLNKPAKYNFSAFSAGRANFFIQSWVLKTENKLRVEIWIGHPKAKSIFRLLIRNKTQIEQEFGEALQWDELPEYKGSRIAVLTAEFDLTKTEERTKQHDWMLEKMERLRLVFAPRLNALDLDSLSATPPDPILPNEQRDAQLVT